MNRLIIRILLVIVAAPCLWSCADDVAPAKPIVVTPDELGKVYMRLNLIVADAGESDTRASISEDSSHSSLTESDTRANPTGGETGDGEEPAINHEAEIRDVALFIYNDVNGEGMNAPAATPIIASFFLTENNLSEINCSNGITSGKEYVIALDEYEYQPTHRVAVVVNSGGLNDNFDTLGKLRSHYGESTFHPGSTIVETTNFLMSNANALDGAIRLCHADKGTPSDPNFHCSVSVERGAARIDIMARESEVNAEKGWLEYDIKGSDNKAIATLRVMDILPVNVSNRGSYLFKHVTRTTTSGFTLSTTLTCSDELTDGLIPTNYVVEPRTANKTTGLAVATLEGYYGETMAAKRLKATDETWSHGSLTKYLPDVFSIKPGENRGNNRSFILAYADENTQPASLHISDFVTGVMMRAVYIPKRIYRDTAVEAFDCPSEPVTFWRYKPTAQAISEDMCIYFETEQLAKDYAKLHPEELGEIDGFENGTCYYHVWIRHAFDEGVDPHHEPFPMEYGIVRNNIYRLGFTFFGPGTPTPTLEEPETVSLRIFVRKWNLREFGTIMM